MAEPIAVVGSSCRFPGGASSPSKLWQLLKNPRDVLVDIPKDRLGLKAFNHEDGEHHGSTNVVAKAYLLEGDPRLFDAPFFNINPMEADAMDPQQRLLLESVYECIEAAGYPLQKMQGSATSVYVGCMTNDFHDIQGRDMEIVNRYHGTGSTRSILSNRISYYFDFRGPSVTMDTACSSSLAALHFAVQSLRGGESTSSIVGGVNLIFDSVAYISESKLHMLSPTSRSSMWDDSADGYARGEGVSALMLKTLSQALADGDHIECLIRETGMNQDGRTTGLTMPSGSAQAALIRQTYARAGLDLRSQSGRPQYFEAHGTGTLAGDPQEARGIFEAFFDTDDERAGRGTNEETLFCGSIKTVIGHLEGCAGLAGLLKASLAVQHGVIPPNLLFSRLNPDIRPYQHRLQVPTEALPWPSEASPRRASVNSFGFGGTNVHAIVEQYIPPASLETSSLLTPADEECCAGPILLSAVTGNSLAASVDALADMLEDENNDLSVEDLAFFTQTRRTTFEQRIWFSGGTRDELVKTLRVATRSGLASNVGERAPTKLKWKTPGILGIFTGQGAQWATMGKDLINRCHAFRQSIQCCEAALQSLSDAPTWSLTEELLRNPSESRLHEAALSQPLCTAIQIALVDTLFAAGISLRGAVGHSSGEIAATYAAGLLSAEDAMRVAFYRGLHAHLAQGSEGHKGAMLAVGLSIDDAEAFCERFHGRLSVAASNSPTSTTLSGDEDAVRSAKEQLDEDQTFARLLKVDTAYHSSHMVPCAQPYLESLKACSIQVRPANEECIWISSVHGHAELLDDPEDLKVLADEYWIANMCQPVLFSEALECSLWRAGPFDLAIEIGAHPALKGPANQTITSVLGPNALPYVATLQRGNNDVQAFSSTLGSLWTTLGSWLDFDGWRKAYLGPQSANAAKVLKDLPTYSWSHEHIFWKESRISSRYRLVERPPHELLGRRAADDSENEMRWRNILKVNELPWVRGHVFQKAILFPTVGYVAQAIEAAAEIVALDQIKLIEICDLAIPRALVLEDSHGGVETVFSIRRQQNSVSIIEAEFACHSSVSGGNLEKNCSGRLIIELVADHEDGNEKEASVLPTRCPPRSGTTSMDGETYYQAILKTTGLDYQGLFRGMKHIRRTLGFSSAQASWTVEEVGSRYLFHPGLLDVALQAILAAFVNPARIPIRGSFLPSALSRLVFDPHVPIITDDGGNVTFESDCFLTNNTARSCEGDIHVFGPSGQCVLQAEGFRMDNWAETSAAEDRPIFSRLEYRPDLFYASTNALPELTPDQNELKLIEAINRASFYYLRTFFSEVSEETIKEWTWDRQAFCKAAKNVIQQTLDGKHPSTKLSWIHDTASLMQEYKQSPLFQNQADMKAVHVAGEHLARVMAGDDRPLEIYLREGVWAPLYSHGRYQVQLNRTIADFVHTFAHRYPRAKYLEAGAGSGGTTIGVLERLGDALDQYTFTDVSAGFFEKARDRIAHTDAAVADRVAYKVLDLERDPVEQGFEAESQDVIIAANVLHATADLHKAVENVRRLLKPGGYLLMLEVTDEYLEGLLLMGPLEGWWLGNREGTASQPGLTLQGWDNLLQETGFSGVDKYQSDVPDPNAYAVSVIVTQATESRVDMLREPLDFLDELPVIDQVLIIGGASMAMSKITKTISQQVSRFAGSVQVVQSVDKIEPDIHIKSSTAVISLFELERPFFADPITETRLQKLQTLFKHATDVLWVTTGHLDDHEPSSAMMIGLCRTMVIELEQLNLQFLNTTTKNPRPSDARVIIEAFVRLSLGKSNTFAASPILWTNEPELTLTAEGEVLIPRLKPDHERNDRLNSAARKISKVEASDAGRHTYTAVHRGNQIHLEEASPWLLAESRRRLGPEDAITIRTTYSLTLPFSSAAVLVTGTDQNDRPALALTDAHSSTVTVRPTSILHLKDAAPCTGGQLRAYALLVFAKHILAAIPPRASLRQPTVIVHGASAALAHVIRQLAARQLRLVFTESIASERSNATNFVALHPKSSNYIIKRTLPANVGFVVALTKDDAVACKLTSIFPGTNLDLDSTFSAGSILPFCELDDFVGDALPLSDDDGAKVTEEVEHATLIPAYQLPNLPASSLEYPSVVDWSDDQYPLLVNVRPIHCEGLFSADKSYLMVSLVSTLGRSICRYMVENGARHIALASRSASVDPQWLEEMAHLGADIRVYRMDISDRESVRSTVAKMRSEMPPIAGVANAALVLRDRPFLDMTASDMNEVLAPKVDGSLNLHEEFKDPDLDFFILFSTLSCVIGNAGQSNYDAASLYQVMLAKHRRQQGLPASVMEVGAVADVGYVAERGQALFDKLARTMKLPLSESDVHQIFAEAVAASPIRRDEVVDSTTAEIVSGMGYYNYSSDAPSEAHPPWFNNLLASHYVREERGSGVVAADTAADSLTVAARLDAAPSEDVAASILTQTMAARVETMLQMSAGSFKVDASLLDVGIDSLLAVELRTWFLKQVHVDVPVLKILSGESGEGICAFAASQYLTAKSKGGSNTAAEGRKAEDAMAERRNSDATSSSSGPSDGQSSSLAASVSTLQVGGKRQMVEEADAPSPQTVMETASMTHAQARLWIADHMSSDLTQNNNVLIYDVYGSVHVGRLSRAMNTVVAHHPGLRTCWFQDAANTLLQGLLKFPPDCFRHVPVTTKDNRNPDTIERVQSELSTREWRLQQGQALEAILVSHTSDKHTLLIGYHHIAMDGAAWRTFFRDLNMAYQGAALPPPSKSPIDLARQDNPNTASAIEQFWIEELSPVPEPLPLLPFASMKTRPPLDRVSNHTSIVQFNGSVVERINSTSRSLGVTTPNFYIAAVQCLLSRIADMEDDICIGVTDSGRDAETAESVGFFLNLLPLRLRAASSASFGELVQQVNKSYRGVREHASVPFDAILENLSIRRDPTCTPLFQVGFDIRPGQSAQLPLGNCQMSIRHSVDSVLLYDITFCVIPMPSSGPSFVQVVTRSDLYSQEATELLAQMYITLLESAAQPSAVDASLNLLQMYPRQDVQKALELGAAKHQKFAGWPSTITERVDQVSQECSSATAIRDIRGSVTYAELGNSVLSLSARLLPFRGLRIAVLCEPQRDWIVGMLATFRVGASFVSLDATLPRARLLAIVNACEPGVVLCHAATSVLASQLVLESGFASQVFNFEEPPAHVVSPDQVQNFEDPTKASLILCTSGTSGAPKAILLSCSGFLNYLANQGELQNLQKGEVMLQKAALGFDMAIAETLLALTHSGALVIAPQAARGDPIALTNLMVQEHVNITFACPTEYLMWLHYGNDTLSRLPTWRLALCGGEKVPEALQRDLQSLPSHPVFQDAYGPTEVSICATMQHDELPLSEYPLTSSATSIGRPLKNVGVFVIDSRGLICPPGIPGEICVTGVGVALGYIDAEATAQSFVKDFKVDFLDGTTRSEGNMYKTGDRGVWREDGTLGYLGRMSNDTVVKIRGLRVDFTDVEDAILSLGSHIISDAVVTLHQDNDDAFLVAHVVVKPDGIAASVPQDSETSEKDVELEGSLEGLMQQLPLPRQMKPSRAMLLERMPLTANGKVDRRRLTQTSLSPRQRNPRQHQHANSLATLTQVQLHLLWKRVLSRTDLPRRTDVDFWAMGGSSLHLVKLQAIIRAELHADVQIRDMFQHSTLGSMASLLDDRAANMLADGPIDWNIETDLADDLRRSLASPRQKGWALRNLSPCEEILITGGDSFLGGHIIQALLRNASVRRINCIAVPPSAHLSFGGDSARISVYPGSLHQQNFGLDAETVSKLLENVDRIVIAGSHGHCLNSYASLRQPNVTTIKLLATWASAHQVPLHYISSSRVTLIPHNSEAALPPISVKDHQPPQDGSEGLTASKWAGEVFLERMVAAMSEHDSSLPVTIHRPCALVGSEAPSEDSLNAILKCSALMNAVPKVSALPISGYFDFAAVEEIAAQIADVVAQNEQLPMVSFRHYSGGVKVIPSEFRSYMEKVHGKAFAELDLQDWLGRALELGMEPMIAVYLRTVVASGQEMVFPFMGMPAPAS